MKTYIYIVFLLTFISCNSKYVLIGAFQGKVYDKTNNKPIKNVLIYTDSTSINFFTPIKTDKNGFFSTNSMTTKDYDFYYTVRKNISYKLIFESKGHINDTIDLREYNKSNRILDSIKLGKVYLKPITLPNKGNR